MAIADNKRIWMFAIDDNAALAAASMNTNESEIAIVDLKSQKSAAVIKQDKNSAPYNLWI